MSDDGGFKPYKGKQVSEPKVFAPDDQTPALFHGDWNPSDENSFTVKLPVRQLPDGTVRVGHEPAPSGPERFTFPVVPNEPEVPMSDTKTSPGPWRWEPFEMRPSVANELTAATGASIGVVTLGEKPDDLLAEADARLIALAPTMASMLEELLEGSSIRTHSETLDAARALLSELRRP